MKKNNMAAVLFPMIIAGSLLIHQFPALAASEKIVTAAQVNGTWQAKNGTFKILALGKQRLKVEFSGIYEYTSPYGPMANTGDASGIAIIEGDTAIFKPESMDKDCRITMTFTEGKLKVYQVGFCGFGNNVTAAGSYRKTSDRKPKFEE
jgi:hypothetical protein